MSRLDLTGILLILVTVLAAATGLTRIDSNTEDVMEWLPDQSDARTELKIFESYFGSDDFLIITWPNCSIGDSRLDTLSDAIRLADRDGLIANLISGNDILERLKGTRMSRSQIIRNLQGVFFGFGDPNLTCIYAELTPHGSSHRRQVMEQIKEATSQVPDLSYEQLTFGGYPFIATTIDHHLMNSLKLLLAPSVILATLMAWFCLRNLVLTAIVFATSIMAATMSLAMIPAFGVKFGGLMSIIPALVFVLATSGCVHLIRYALSAGVDPKPLLRMGWLPCSVSALTTIVGMLSLMQSQFPAIRKFGLFCAIGVGVTLVFQLIMIPWLLHRFGGKGIETLAERDRNSRFWENWVDRMTRRPWPAFLLSIAVLATGLYGLLFLQAEVEIDKLFKPDSPVLKSLRDLEHQLGPIDQSELLILFDQADRDHFHERANQVRQIQNAIKQIPEVKFTHSLVNYLPSEPRARDARSFVARQGYRDMLRIERARMANTQLLHVDESLEIWRISLRFPFTADYDWEHVGEKVKKIAEAIVAETRSLSNASATAAPRVIHTGRSNLFQHAQKNLIHDLFRNFMLAFVIITPMLMIALRSVAIGLLAMVPNVFPVTVLFGGAGFLGYPIDMAVAMTACIALGIAVDDTTHFLVRFREFGGSLSNVSTPIARALAQCGPAMLHTTFIACGGLLVYAFAEMQVIVRFAFSISALLVLAFLGDLIMMPAILLIINRWRQKNQPDEEQKQC